MCRYNLNAEKKQKTDPVVLLPMWGIAGEAILNDKYIVLNDVEDHEGFDPEIDCPNFKVKTPSLRQTINNTSMMRCRQNS